MSVYKALANFLILVTCSSSIVQAQNKVLKINEYYSYLNIEIEINKILKFENLQFTSLIIETNEKYDGEIIIYYASQNDENLILKSKLDENENSSEYRYSNTLQVFSEVQNRIKIDFGNFKGKVKISLIYAPRIEIKNNFKFYKNSNPCEKPPMISYNVWRKGLPDPKPPREKTEVEHLVIHHSAGSNSDTDYINTVRNIYLLHTQSNGWDDIGYNFLIAPNGLIFNGRDPQGAGDDDEILGAHFCSKNQNTMGVCLLGNFMSAKPSNEALFSLKYLLAWKLKKNEIDAFGQSKHPKPDGNMLNNTCGHRDGCGTSCPGDSLYIVLNKMRKEASRIADSCGLVLNQTYFNYEKKIIIFPNPSKDGQFNIQSCLKRNAELLIYDINGKLIKKLNLSPFNTISLQLTGGIYLFRIISENEILLSQVLVIK